MHLTVIYLCFISLKLGVRLVGYFFLLIKIKLKCIWDYSYMVECCQHCVTA
jgi:hypothetical protein